MLISRNVLKGIFKDELPSTDKIAEGLTMHAFEVEGIERVGSDEVLDVDVLPNRAHDCLSHLGVAGEISRIFDIEQTKTFQLLDTAEQARDTIKIDIENKLADRFIVAVIEGLDKQESPQWLKEALVSFGERSISPIVDAMNYIMFLTGQPLHAYDLDKLEEYEGERRFTVREAREGETFTSLEEEVVECEGGELVIAGAKSILGLAGIKGGISTAVDGQTRRIALEAATFSPVRVRKTAQSTKIKTNASKRFENGISPELAALGIAEAVQLLEDIFSNAHVTALRDEYPHKPTFPQITLSATLPGDLLGVDIPKATVQGILEKMGCNVTENASTFTVTPPFERLDLSIPEDLVEEIGRLYGYEHITPAPLPDHTRDTDTATLKTELVLKRFLASNGFSEIITRAFRNEGDIEVANPLANQEPFLRTELTQSMLDILETNIRNAELIGKEALRTFEVGTVFPKEGEKKSLVLGYAIAKGAKKKMGEDAFKEEAERLLSEALHIDEDAVRNARVGSTTRESSVVLEFDFTQLLSVAETLPVFESSPREPFSTFSNFSSFPFVLRDIAVWTPEGTSPEDVELTIKESAGDLLQRIRLFDRFEKTCEDGSKRISYAFRLVFQSFERTLSDEEVNMYMKAIESALTQTEGFEIR